MTASGETIGLDVFYRLGALVAGEPDLQRAIQLATDAATEITGAEFGAFFYNVEDAASEGYTLYTLSGVEAEAFAKFPMPRKTAIFAPTFDGEGVIRSDDITKDPRYGKNAPRHGMPEGHLPVRSYLSAPVFSGSGEVLGGLFLGHKDAGRFGVESERLVSAVAAQAAIAIDNARLFRALSKELVDQRNIGERLRGANEVLETRIRARDAAVPRARDEHRLFKLLVQGVVDYAIYMLDLDGRVSSWNSGAERNKGYCEEEILGQHFSIFYTPEAREAGEPERALREARDKGRVEMIGWRVRKGGQRFWASVIIDAIYDDDGELAGFAKVTRDITEQREAARALEEAREALFQAQKMEAVGQLTGGIAHDFNNMLAGIIGAINLLERRIKAERYDEAREYADAALDAANRAAALTSRLLAFGRRQTLDLKAIDVNDTVRSVEGLLQRSAGENVIIATNLTPGLPLARSDAHQLESALLNLTINARDAMPDGGRISISTGIVHQSFSQPDFAAGDYVLLSVADTGAGMSPEVLSRAFEPFYTTKPSGAGTGLGLSMVYGFVKQSGGHASIESLPGHGATINLFLPVSTEGAVRDETPPAHSQTPGRGEAVLVVEDDALVRTLVMDVLRDLGYAGIQAADAKEAIPYLESRRRIDLLVSDVGLPGMNGRQLADIARQHHPDLPVLFLTGYAEHASVRSTFLGVNMDLMTKPFAIDALAAKIEDMLRVP